MITLPQNQAHPNRVHTYNTTCDIYCNVGSNETISTWPNADYEVITIHCHWGNPSLYHDDVIKWKHFPRYWPFVRGIHRSPVNSPHKGQWRGALMFTLICARINGWVNNGEAGDLRRNRAHYDVIVMFQPIESTFARIPSKKQMLEHCSNDDITNILLYLHNWGRQKWKIQPYYHDFLYHVIVDERYLLEPVTPSPDHPRMKYYRTPMLTHWGQVTHICVSKQAHHWLRQWLVSFSWPSHYLNQYWLIVKSTIGSTFQWNWNHNTKIFIFKKMHAKMSSAKMAAILFKNALLWFITDADKPRPI